MYKLIIIEDERLLRERLIEMIDFSKFECVFSGSASNGKEGIALIKKVQPDIVLLDLNMPLIDGLDVLRFTKEKFNYEAIIITGYAEFEYAKEAISLGVSDYLLKPVEQSVLDTALARVVAKRTPVTKIYQNENHSEYTKQALSYIESNSNRTLPLSEIASQLKVSSDHLNRVFKQDTGMTLHKAIIIFRIEQACILLEHEEARINEIANQVGFKDYKYFYQVFKQIKHQSPKNYQKYIKKQQANEAD